MMHRDCFPPLIVAAATVGLFYAATVPAPARRVREARADLAAANARMRASSEAIQRVRNLEQECAGIRKQLAQRSDATITPLVWFPQEMSKHFEQFGITKVSTRINTGLPEPALPGYQRTFWAVTLPLEEDPAEVVRTLLAIASLEAGDPLLRVHTVSAIADAGPEVLGGRRATVTVSLLTRQF
jgi:hypothetical protein